MKCSEEIELGFPDIIKLFKNALDYFNFWLKVNIFNQSDYASVDKKRINSLIRKVVKGEGFQLTNLNIVITDNNYLKKLNKMFFKKNRPTNVISFNMDEVCEIYVSRDKVKDTKDLYYYIIHGLLHIIGYDHRNKEEVKIMENKCLKYLEYIK